LLPGTTYYFALKTADEVPNWSDLSDCVSATTPVPATIDIQPHTLNVKSNGKWISCYMELSEGYSVAGIDVSTVLLESSIPAELHPTQAGDYDHDGVGDLMVKFDRQALIAYLGGRTGEVMLTATGELKDGTLFEGTDTVRVIQ
jgi:hypothetical protein